MWWIVGTHTGPNMPLDLPVFISWLTAVAAVGVLSGVAFALWLDRGIIGRLRGLANGLASGRVADLRGLPGGAGWGELSRLTLQVQALLTHQRQIARAGEDLGLIRSQLATLRGSLERWTQSERWDALTIESGALAPLSESLDRGLRRLDDAREQNLTSVREVGDGIADALTDARETAGEAERGFVEATALLTTVRELQRLGGELEQSLSTIAAGPSGYDAQALDGWRAAARAAIHELVESSSGSVEHLGRGLMRVQEIADQVHLVANRATLIALNAALTGARQGRPEPEMMELSEEMKRLASEVRTATERTTTLSLELDGEVNAAVERMRGVRQRVAQRLEELPTPAPTEFARPGEPTRLLERMKEMIQDAAQKGERLSAAGERVSTVAERLVHRLEEEGQELEGLVVRLSPSDAAGTPAAELHASQDRESPEEPLRLEPNAPPNPGLKLLGQDDLLGGERSEIDRWRAGGPGAGRGERS